MTEEFRALLKNKKNGYELIRSILDTYEVGQQFMDSTITLLLSHHPDKEKVAGLDYCALRLHPTYRQKTLYIKTKDKEEDSVSWKTCVDNILDKYDAKKSYITAVLSAFRIATFDEVRRAFFNNNTRDDSAICEYCKETCYSKHLNKPPAIHIDHHLLSFHEIVSTFMSDNSLTAPDVDIKYVGLESHIKDELLKQKWIQYHNSVVTYRILCSSCNGRFGKKHTL